VNRRMGFTVVEIMVVVVIAGMLMLLGWPRVREGMVRTNVRGARVTVANMLAKARAASTQTGRPTWVQLAGNKAYIQARPRVTVGGAGACQCDTIGAVEDLNAKYGVTLTTTVDSIQFDPRGLGSWVGGPSHTITVSKSSLYNTIKVDGLGRVTQ
jgi:Tfp pilus assembly protein FimT